MLRKLYDELSPLFNQSILSFLTWPTFTPNKFQNSNGYCMLRSLLAMASASDSWPRLIVIDVPTDASTHWPGQMKAPETLRKAGLTGKLECVGYQISSLSALDQPSR